MALNLVYVAIELGAGFYTGSLALMADAGHNFSDASGLFLAWLAFRLIRIRSTRSNTYGQRKSSILLSVANSLLIVGAVVLILEAAVRRFSHLQQLDGVQVSIVAAAGVLINFLTALLLFRDRKKDINLRGAYLHMLADGLVSLGVIVSGVVIRFTALYWIDPAISIVIALVVLVSTWGLLRDSLRLASDAIPKGVDLEQVVRKMKSVKGVLGVHHLHIWSISTAENALTGHIVVSAGCAPAEIQRVIHQVKHELVHLGIAHATLETEFVDQPCEEQDCHE